MADTKTCKMYLGDTLISGGGEPLVEFCQINPIVKAYLENTTYNPNDYTVSSVGDYASQTTSYNKYQPSGYELEVEKGTLYIADDYGTTSEPITADGTKKIYNIMPTKGGIYANVDENGTVVKSGKLIPNGSLRMLYVENVQNVRDLGGWSCDGGTVKYGKIIRGTELNRGYTLTENGKNVLRNLIKIDHEIDFREADEWTDTVSALGSDVAYTHIPFGYYGNAVVNASLQASFVKIFRTLLECVKNGENAYIHCQSGMDRCGTVCFFLESILGMSQSDIDKDYELSTFFVYPTLKTRNSDVYVGLVNAFNSYAGNTHRDRVVNWMLTIGITIDEINEFRNAMIDGTPQTLTANVNNYSVTNVLTNVSSDNNSVSALEYQPYTANVKAESGYIIESVSVTMGGVDITSQVWSGNKTHRNRMVTHNLDGVTLSNAKKIVREGQCYATFVIPNEGYTLENANVTITMGGVNMSTYYKDGAIVIPNVNGDIQINITAVAQGSAYTNLAEPLPNNTTDTTKWVNGYRYSSSGISAQSGTTISNLIPCKDGDIVRVKGVSLRESTDRISVYWTESEGTIGYFNIGITNSAASVTYKGLENGVYAFQVASGGKEVIGFRFAMPTPADASAVIITVNEEIE